MKSINIYCPVLDAYQFLSYHFPGNEYWSRILRWVDQKLYWPEIMDFYFEVSLVLFYSSYNVVV